MPVEVLVEADFMADLGLIQIDPCFINMGAHFTLEIVVDIVLKRSIFRLGFCTTFFTF